MREKWVMFKFGYQYQRPKPPADPLVNSMYQIDGEMQRILNRDDLDQEQKLSLYDEKLKTYLNRYEKYRHPAPVQSSIHVLDETTTPSTSRDMTHILETVPKQVQPHSKLFLQRLNDVMSWNDKGEIYLKGEPPIQGSNITDLLGTAVRPHALKSVSSNPVGMDTFIHGMREANIPHSWIRNRAIINRMQNEKKSDDFSRRGGFGTPSHPKTGGTPSLLGTKPKTGGFGTPSLLGTKPGGFGTPLPSKTKDTVSKLDDWEDY